MILVALVAFHVGIFDFPRGYFLFSTWGRNDSSEVSFDSSEVLFRPYVGIFSFPRGDLEIPTSALHVSPDRVPMSELFYTFVVNQKT